MKWLPKAAIVSVDTETTDKDPERARVIDIAAAYIKPGEPLDLRQAYVDPGMPIPAESTKVHGLTDEKIQAEGKPAAEVLDLFLGEIALAMIHGTVLLIQNARYDLTVLDREAGRLYIPSLRDRLGGTVAPVLDPIVLDKRLIKYRSRVSDDQGARVLKTLARIYGVDWDDEQAHGAGYDAVITARVAWKMAGWCALPRHELKQKQTCLSATWKKVRDEDADWFERVAAMSPMDLHEAQIEWAAEQADGLATYWRGLAAELREQAELDEPPAVEGLPDATADERRQALRQQAGEIDADADSVRGDWPYVPLEVAA